MDLDGLLYAVQHCCLDKIYIVITEFGGGGMAAARELFFPYVCMFAGACCLRLCDASNRKRRHRLLITSVYPCICVPRFVDALQIPRRALFVTV